MARKRARHVTGERPVRLNEPKPPTAGLDKRRKKKEAESHPATSVRYCQHPAGLPQDRDEGLVLRRAPAEQGAEARC
jgi:hypothetical protein